jgi:hypothetical protein
METMTHEAKELELYIENDADLYRQQTKPIQDNLRRKFKAGKYQHDLAPKLWSYLVENGAKKYCNEFCSNDQKWFQLFTPSIRKEVAQSLADFWLAELKLGN